MKTNERAKSQAKINFGINIKNAKLNEQGVPYDAAVRAISDLNYKNTHTPEEIKTTNDYINSVNSNILDYVNKCKSNEQVAKEINLAASTDRANVDITRITGIDASNNKNVLEKDAINHIKNRHGENGTHDTSMADDNTLARIEYVLENYDEAFLGKKGQTRIQLADGSLAPTVVFVKKIDGQYYVAEVVSDSKSRKNRILSAYIGDVM